MTTPSEGEAMLALADAIEAKTGKPCGEFILASLEARLVVPALRAAAQSSGVREALLRKIDTALAPNENKTQ